MEMHFQQKEILAGETRGSLRSDIWAERDGSWLAQHVATQQTSSKPPGFSSYFMFLQAALAIRTCVFLYTSGNVNLHVHKGPAVSVAAQGCASLRPHQEASPPAA